MLKTALIATLTFITLLNPIQKIFIIFSLQKDYTPRELLRITNRSSATALVVLLLFLVAGNQLLCYVFNIEIYSFQIICGIILCINGLMALQKGTFFRIKQQSRMEDIIAVPIAVPMIAGPASITAAVTMPSIYGMAVSVVAIVLGIAVNWLVMRYSGVLGRFMVKHNILNPLLRIFGLLIAAIGTQMIMNGIRAFVAGL